MKKFFILLLAMLVLFPAASLAATSSPTIKKMYYTNPEIPFEILDDLDMVLDITEKLPSDELKGYELYEAAYIILEHEYGTVEFRMPYDFSKSSAAKVVLIGESIIAREAKITSKGNLIVDFTDIEPRVYYIYFFIKD